jgi:hypothetical protein
MATYIFKTPYVEEGPTGKHRLFYFYKLRQGLTVVKSGTTYATKRWLLDDAVYDVIYRGGHEYEVTESEKAALIAGGIGVTEANFRAV